jgi:hypothetical protein
VLNLSAVSSELLWMTQVGGCISLVLLADCPI